METPLFLLVVFGFAAFMIAGFSILISLILAAVTGLIYIAFRYPHMPDDWPLNKTGTGRFLALTLIGLLIIILLNMARDLFNSLSLNTICVSTLIIGFIALIFIGIAAPNGIKLELGEE